MQRAAALILRELATVPSQVMISRGQLSELVGKSLGVDLAVDVFAKRSADFWAGEKPGDYHRSGFRVAFGIAGSPMSFAR